MSRTFFLPYFCEIDLLMEDYKFISEPKKKFANKLTKQIFGEFSLRKIEKEGTLTTVKQSPCWETGFSLRILKQILFIPEFLE